MDFIKKTFTVILLSTIVIWLLQHFDFQLAVVADSSNSILATLGRVLSLIFAPLGFQDWRISAALLTGFGAKEIVLSTLSVLTAAGSPSILPALLPQLLSPPAALSFLVFLVLYTPCIAAISAVRRELGSMKAALTMIVVQTALAWIIALFIYRLSSLFLT